MSQMFNNAPSFNQDIENRNVVMDLTISNLKSGIHSLKKIIPEIDRFVTPDQFNHYKNISYSKGFLIVASSPLTRSSYHASDDFKQLKIKRISMIKSNILN